MLDLALIITKGALLRDEFRGAHYKPEFPNRDDAHWLKTTIATYDPARVTRRSPTNRWTCAICSRAARLQQSSKSRSPIREYPIKHSYYRFNFMEKADSFILKIYRGHPSSNIGKSSNCT